jgi:hypothetical protein
MPNRIIHEKATESQTLDLLSADAECLFWRLITKADDYGRFDADPRVLLAKCFPLRVGRMKADRVAGWLEEMASAGLVDLYRVGDRSYGVLRTWSEHQRQRESKPKYPDPASGTPCAANGRGSPQPAAYARAGVSRVESRESRVERREADGAADGGETPPAAGLAAPTPVFQVPESIVRALDGAPRLGVVAAIRDPAFWQAEIRANPGLDLAVEVRKAEAHLIGSSAHYKRLKRFLHDWIKRSQRWSHE